MKKISIIGIAWLVAACGEPERRDTGQGPLTGANIGDTGDDFDDGYTADGDSGGVPGAGEGCDDADCNCEPGEVQACWPGNPNNRGVGACQDGQQSCLDSGVWGPCEGAVLPSEEIPDNCIDESCDGFSPGCDQCLPYEVCGSGTDDDCNGLTDCDDPACECDCTEKCIPGSWRYCDEPKFCAWGRQDCAPDGTWGACIETDDIPPQCDEDDWVPFPIPTTYDPQCCVAAGYCCQNYGADPTQPLDASIGDCDGIVEYDCSDPSNPPA